MQCPWCGAEMEAGLVQSARKIFFTTGARKSWFFVEPEGGDITLSRHNATGPACTARHCARCKRIVLDYSGEADGKTCR